MKVSVYLFILFFSAIPVVGQSDSDVRREEGEVFRQNGVVMPYALGFPMPFLFKSKVRPGVDFVPDYSPYNITGYADYNSIMIHNLTARYNICTVRCCLSQFRKIRKSSCVNEQPKNIKTGWGEDRDFDFHSKTINVSDGVSLLNDLWHLCVISNEGGDELCEVYLGCLIKNDPPNYLTPVLIIGNDIQHPLTKANINGIYFEILSETWIRFRLDIFQADNIYQIDYAKDMLLPEGWSFERLRKLYIEKVVDKEDGEKNKDVEATQEVEQTNPKWKRCNVQ